MCDQLRHINIAKGTLVKLVFAFSVAFAIFLMNTTPAFALPPPTPDAINQYVKDGTLPDRINFAKQLGDDKMDPGLVAFFNARMKALKTNSKSPLPEFWSHGMPSTGNVCIPAIVIDFPDAPFSLGMSANDIKNALFGPSDPNSLSSYYKTSSYGKLDISGDVLGIYTSQHTLAYYKSLTQTEGPLAVQSLIKEALDYYKNQGWDFSKYDSNNDGNIDSLYVLWVGPSDGWAAYWSTYENEWLDSNYTLDGKRVFKYVMYSVNDYGGIKMNVLEHETGHLLGIPDYYSYDIMNKTNGLKGGLGGFDLMDSDNGDHNIFSKYLLGWISPQIVTTGSKAITLMPSTTHSDGLLIMPNWNGNADSEYYMAEYYTPEGNFTGSNFTPGIRIFHIDATLDSSGYYFLCNNTDSSHKLIRLMEADSYESIEMLLGFDNGDLYREGKTFGPDSFPNSDEYNGTYSGIQLNDIILNNESASMKVAFVQSTAKPAVLRTYPAENSVLAGEEDSMQITFDNVVYSGAGFSNITLIDKSGSSIPVSASINKNVLTISPLNDLAGGGIYTLTVPSGAIRNSIGNQLSASITLHFTTANSAIVSWCSNITLPGISFLQVRTTAEDKQGNVYIEAMGRDSNSADKAILLKLDQNGNIALSKILDNSYVNDFCYSAKIIILPDGGMLLYTAPHIYKFDSDFNAVWNIANPVANPVPCAIFLADGTDSFVTFRGYSDGVVCSQYNADGTIIKSHKIPNISPASVSKMGKGYLLETITDYSDGAMTFTQLDENMDILKSISVTLPKSIYAFDTSYTFPDIQASDCIRCVRVCSDSSVRMIRVHWDSSSVDEAIVSNTMYPSFGCNIAASEDGTIYLDLPLIDSTVYKRNMDLMKILPDSSVEWKKIVKYQQGNIDCCNFNFNSSLDGIIAQTYVADDGSSIQWAIRKLSITKASLITSPSYYIDEANKLIKVSVKTSVSQLIANLSNDSASIKVFDKNGVEFTGNTLASGMVVKLIISGTVVDQLTVSVLGDVNGDGIIDITDILYIRAKITNTYTMQPFQTLAADIKKDNVIDINDILYIRAHILGTYTIHAS